MAKILVITTLLFLLSATSTQALDRSNSGWLLVDLKTQKVTKSHNAKHYFTPASTTKLFTATAALLQLGADYQFKTILSQKNGNIYLQFNTDPSLNKSAIKQLLLKLKKQTIKGDFVIDTSAFKGPSYPLGIVRQDTAFCYAAPIQAAIINENCFPINLKLHNQSFNSTNRMINSKQLKAANNKQLKTCVFHIQKNKDNHLTLSGCLPKRKKWQFNMAIPEPNLFAKNYIHGQLKQLKVKLEGRIVFGKTPPHSKIIAIHKSIKLIKLLTHMLQVSDNTYANAITATIGRSYYGVGSIKAGSSAIKAILAKKVAANLEKINIEDGAGSSTYNLISPQQLVTLLSKIWPSEIGKQLRSAMAIGGKNGTLRNRKLEFKNAKVLAKSGSMSGVSNLAGYVIKRNNITVFAIMQNGIRGSLTSERQWQSKFLSSSAV